MKDYLTNLLDNALKNLIEDFDQDIIQVSRPKQIQHGDFSTNVSLPLASIYCHPISIGAFFRIFANGRLTLVEKSPC